MSKRPPIRPSKFHEDKKLVTDQPGWSVIFAGLLLSFFLGFTLKGLLSASRIKALVEQAASKIHKDIRVTLGSAQFSLADGWWPQARVIITDVRMEASQDCWMNPVLSVDQIELPVSIKALVRGQVPFTEIQANDVQLRFRSNYVACNEHQKVAEFASQTVKTESSPTFIRMKNTLDQTAEVESTIEKVSIRHLLVLHQQYPQLPIDLQNVFFEGPGSEPKKFTLKARTNLIRDLQVNDYLAHANILVEYAEAPEKKVEAHVFGNWREGHYSLNSSFKLDDQNLGFDFDLEHIPLAKIMPLLKQYGVVQNDYNVKEVWLSMKAQTKGSVKSLLTSGAEIHDFKVEGDLGNISTEQVKIKTLAPLLVQPFRLQVSRLNVDRLFLFLNRQRPPNFLGSLGEVFGTIDYFDENNLSIKGLYKGLEFVFSNQGMNERQTFETMAGELKLVNGSWQAKVDDFRLIDGLLEGQIDLKASKDFRDVKLNAAIDDLAFSAAVEKVVTNGGDLGHFNGKIEARFLSGILAELRGQVKAEKAEMQGVLLDDTKFILNSGKDGFDVKATAKNLVLQKASLANEMFLPLFQGVSFKDGINLKSVSAKILSKDLRDFSWKGFSANVPEKDLSISSDGGWDERGMMFGQINMNGRAKKTKVVIKGNRDNPNFQIVK